MPLTPTSRVALYAAMRGEVQNLAARLPRATLRWHPGGHALLIECPEFWADVADFFNGA
jgi:hypothetical protein